MKQSPFLMEAEDKWIIEVALVTTAKLNEMFLNENFRDIQIVNSLPHPDGFADFVILIKYQKKIQDEKRETL